MADTKAAAPTKAADKSPAKPKAKAKPKEHLFQVHPYPVLETQSESGELFKVHCGACGYVQTQFETKAKATADGVRHEKDNHLG